MASEHKRVIRRAATNDDGIDPRADADAGLTPGRYRDANRSCSFHNFAGNLGNDTRGYLRPRRLSRRDFLSAEGEREEEEEAREIENGRRVAERRNHPRAALRIDSKLGSCVGPSEHVFPNNIPYL